VLFKPDAHEPLVDDVWNEEHVRRRVREIAADAQSTWDQDTFWPAHEWESWHARLPLKTLYTGAAGVVWALDSLGRVGFADIDLDLAAIARRVLERYREEPDHEDGSMPGFPLPPTWRSSLWLGETGVALVAWRLDPTPQLADKLYELVSANVHNETLELMWGAPGTMLVARAMLEWTGEQRWDEVWRASADAVWNEWGYNDGGCRIWRHRLYGGEYESLGPAHGLVGNVVVLAQVGERLDELARDASATIARTAVVENGLANWPRAIGRDLVEDDGEIRVQWCHGSPGIVASMAEHATPELDELLLAGGELVWLAGPPRADLKGAGLCHGTAGCGLAFLKLFRRTGDELWLDRARRFAMHALAEVDALPPRYSLWTGSVGAALFATRCIGGNADVPTIDSWD